MTDSKVETMTLPAQQAETSGSEVKKHFDEIFLEHWPRIYSILARLLGDSSEAEDLALETFMRLYQSAETGQKGFNLGGWLYRVAYHLGLNAIRSRQRRRQYELTSGMQVIFESNTDGPAEVYAAEETREALQRVLAEMNPRQSQLLMLRYSGMSYQEVAEVLGVSATSIGPLLVRAESEFEKRYRSIFPEGG